MSCRKMGLSQCSAVPLSRLQGEVDGMKSGERTGMALAVRGHACESSVMLLAQKRARAAGSGHALAGFGKPGLSLLGWRSRLMILTNCVGCRDAS